MDDRVAKTFLSLGIQHWGQSDAERKKAKDNYLKAAGFDLTREHAEAVAWLNGVLDKMPWGRFENEADHLQAALDERNQVQTTSMSGNAR